MIDRPSHLRPPDARRVGLALVELPAVSGVERKAFTLVELLVVIGIVALLIAFLMPALAGARQSAHQVKCLANLRSIGAAAQMHVNEHHGYLPTAGLQWNCVGGVCDPHGLQDENRQKYDYYEDQGIERPLPVTVALAAYLGVRCRTDSRDHLIQDMSGDALKRLFRCPAESVDRLGWTEAGDGSGTWTAPDEFSSYVFNEALLGRREAPRSDQCPRGAMANVRDPAGVAFAMDGRPRDTQQDRFLLFFDHTADDTLADFEQYILTSPRGKELLDFGRHHGRINVVFVDGHAESFSMGLPPTAEGSELNRVYVSRGLAE